jgi:hypothetical protein
MKNDTVNEALRSCSCAAAAGSSWPDAAAYGHPPTAKSSTTPLTKDFQIFGSHFIFHDAGGVGPAMRAGRATLQVPNWL